MSSHVLKNPANYERRLYELCRFAEAVYGIDHIHMKIIAACLLEVQHFSNPPWIICDSLPHNFWDALPKAVNIAEFRMYRPRITNPKIEQRLDKRHENFLMYEFRYKDRKLGVSYKSRYPELVAQCLRLRVPLNQLRISTVEQDNEFQRLLRAVLDKDGRTHFPIPAPANETLLNNCRLLSLLNEELTVYRAIVNNVSMLLSCHAVLQGRDYLEEQDYRAGYRVMLDSVRPWVMEVMKAMCGENSGLDLSTLEIETLLPRLEIKEICAELTRMGLLEWPVKISRTSGKASSRHKYIRLATGIGEDVRMFVNGQGGWWGKGWQDANPPD